MNGSENGTRLPEQVLVHRNEVTFYFNSFVFSLLFVTIKIDLAICIAVLGRVAARTPTRGIPAQSDTIETA